MSDSDNKENETKAGPSEETGTGTGTSSESEAIEKIAGKSDEDGPVDAGESEVVGQEHAAETEVAAGHVGVQRYVHAAFFSAGILTAYLCGKIMLSAWNSLAEWPSAVRALPSLIAYTEDERASMTLVIGAVVGVFLVLRYYRRPSVRSWATDVASELARVTWPDKETVTNGTIVVLIAGVIATVYIALLDRFWSYLTNLIYGA